MVCGQFLIYLSSKKEVKKDVEAILTVFTQLGWKINWRKSNLVLEQQKTFLGFIINLIKEPTLKVPYQKKKSIKKKVKKLLRSTLKSKRIKVKCIARVAELYQAISKVVTFTLIYIRTIEMYFQQNVKTTMK
jgi:hypothetical protein